MEWSEIILAALGTLTSVVGGGGLVVLLRYFLHYRKLAKELLLRQTRQDHELALEREKVKREADKSDVANLIALQREALAAVSKEVLSLRKKWERAEETKLEDRRKHQEDLEALEQRMEDRCKAEMEQLRKELIERHAHEIKMLEARFAQSNSRDDIAG